MFTKSSPKDVFAVLFVNGGTPMKIAPSKKIMWLKRPFLSENSDSAVFVRPLPANDDEFWEN